MRPCCNVRHDAIICSELPAENGCPIIDLIELTGHIIGMLAEDRFNGGRLSGVVVSESNTMGIDVVDLGIEASAIGTGRFP